VMQCDCTSVRAAKEKALYNPSSLEPYSEWHRSWLMLGACKP